MRKVILDPAVRDLAVAGPFSSFIIVEALRCLILIRARRRTRNVHCATRHGERWPSRSWAALEVRTKTGVRHFERQPVNYLDGPRNNFDGCGLEAYGVGAEYDLTGVRR